MQNTDHIRHRARQLDQDDPLAHYREAFFDSGEALIYLDGNSLGRLAKSSVDLLDRAVSYQWGERLIRSWNEQWYTKSSELGDKIAPIAGAGKGEVIVTDNTSSNLYKLGYAALRFNAGRRKIVTDDLNFPSDLYILQGLIKQYGTGYELVRVPSGDGISVSMDDLADAIDEETALVSLSHVTFRSSFMYDMKKVTEMAHAKGALVLWDLSHSIGAVPGELKSSGADLAVGCTYKYLNGGPGSPAFLYVKEALHEALESPVWGWFGEYDPFEFSLDYRAGKGIRKFLSGSPPLLSMVAMEPTLDMINEAGMAAIREKSIQQSELFIELARERLFPIGFSLGSPAESTRRGSHVTLKHPEAFRICKALIDPGNNGVSVIPDFRAPDNIRIGITPLYTRYADLLETVSLIQVIVEQEQFLNYSEERDPVT